MPKITLNRLDTSLSNLYNGFAAPPFEGVSADASLPSSTILGANVGDTSLYTSNPFDIVQLQNVQHILGRSLQIRYIPKDQLASLSAKGNAPSIAEAVAALSDNELASVEQGGLDTDASEDDLEDAAHRAPVVRLVNAIIGEAHVRRASDIHMEMTPQGVFLRYRIDGVVYDQVAPPKALYPAIVSRIKILAGLNIAERRLPQDGRIRIRLGESELDIRVATAPAVHGESVALRLLDQGSGVRSLSGIGLSNHALDRLQEALRERHGIILATGPTGSGKTTTLYAMLQTLRGPDRKVLTLEDPVEYEIPGVTQIQVRPKIGLTFAAGLRSLLRHDPDVLLVGEIRDKETAEMATQASLTGHLVLSSLHTNDAPSALTRLVDMGIEPFLVASTVRAVIAQRLVRVLCHECKRPTGNSEAPYDAVGCEHCSGTGYYGRTAVCEVMHCSQGLVEKALAQGSTDAVRELALQQGMRTMYEDAWEKVAQGVTTAAEVDRVIGAR